MNNAAFPILDEIDRLKAAIDALRPLDPEVEERVIDRFRLEWNYHSNALEGNTLSLGETKAFLLEGITAQGKPFKDYLDIKGHDAAIDYLLDFLGHDQHLTEVDIRRLHEILLVESYDIDAKTPHGRIIKRKVELGRYKRHPNHVETVTGKVHYYATPKETPAKMQDLMDWYREREQTGDLHPVVVAALFHHRFVEIHPFDDGNGRMARLLTNLHLMKHGYPPVIFKKEDRRTYFLALAQADEGASEDFVHFLAAQLAASMDLYLRGARGEDISELEDFDKRVALLKQRLETSAVTRSEKTIESQVRLFEQLIEPLLSKLVSRLAQVDVLFAKHSSEIRWVERQTKASLKTKSFKFQNKKPDLTPIREALSGTDITSVLKTDIWSLMKTRQIDSKLSSTISLILDSTSFSLTHVNISGETEKLFSGPYSSTFSEDEIDQFSVEILDNLYKKLDSLAS